MWADSVHDRGHSVFSNTKMHIARPRNPRARSFSKPSPKCCSTASGRPIRPKAQARDSAVAFNTAPNAAARRDVAVLLREGRNRFGPVSRTLAGKTTIELRRLLQRAPRRTQQRVWCSTHHALPHVWRRPARPVIDGFLRNEERLRAWPSEILFRDEHILNAECFAVGFGAVLAWASVANVRSRDDDRRAASLGLRFSERGFDLIESR